MFRTVNEKVKELNETFETFTGEPSPFICECDNLECGERISLRVADFDRIRQAPNRFVVKPGHEAAKRYERVVEDLGAFGESVFLDPGLGEQARAKAAELGMGYFAPGGMVERAELVTRHRWPAETA